MATSQQVQEFHDAYVEALIWQDTDDDISSQHYEGIHAFDDGSVETIGAEVDDFLSREVCDLIRQAEAEHGYSWSQAGHDFALTRNHHGAGFWDRGLGEVGDKLTKAAQAYGETAIWQREDGKLEVDS